MLASGRVAEDAGVAAASETATPATTTAMRMMTQPPLKQNPGSPRYHRGFPRTSAYPGKALDLKLQAPRSVVEPGARNPSGRQLSFERRRCPTRTALGKRSGASTGRVADDAGVAAASGTATPATMTAILPGSDSAITTVSKEETRYFMGVDLGQQQEPSPGQSSRAWAGCWFHPPRQPFFTDRCALHAGGAS
jgi:hypothetical protein